MSQKNFSRKIGNELDKRLTKSKLISQIKKKIKIINLIYNEETKNVISIDGKDYNVDELPLN